MNQSKIIAPPIAVRGMLDLKNWDFEQDGPIDLIGEYEFYWNQLLMPQDFDQTQPSLKAEYIKVPKAWNGFEYQGNQIAGEGYATYRLKILLNSNNTPLAVRLLDMSSSFDLFINGQKITSAGTVGKTAESAKAGY